MRHIAHLTIELEIGSRLRSARRSAGLTQEGVEVMTAGEFTQPSLSAYERGVHCISIPRLVALAELYGVPASELIPDGAL